MIVNNDPRFELNDDKFIKLISRFKHFVTDRELNRAYWQCIEVKGKKNERVSSTRRDTKRSEQ